MNGDDLIALCKQELSPYKAPKTVEFWEKLPRSGVGKVLKRKVQRALLGRPRAENLSLGRRPGE